MSDDDAHQRADDRPANPANLDDLTALVLRVFSDVLGLDGVAEDDHFFDACGGTSVQAWWAIAGITDLLGVDMEFKELLGAPTARDTAALLLGVVAAQQWASVERR